MELGPAPSGTEAHRAVIAAPVLISLACSLTARAASRGQNNQDPAFALARLAWFFLLSSPLAATGGAIFKRELRDDGAHKHPPFYDNRQGVRERVQSGRR